MSNEADSQSRQLVLSSNICDLLYDLSPSTYDEITPKLEFWIEYVLDERFTTATDLARRVSCVAWESRGSHSDVSRFLKEFRNTPTRSQRTRSFVDKLCHYVIRWFVVASSEDLWSNWQAGSVSECGGPGFVRAASFVGCLIQCGLVDHKLVRRHILKPLTAHYYIPSNSMKQTPRAHAIYQLFVAAGDTLLQGLLEPQEVQDCFEKLEIRVSFGEIKGVDGFDPTKLDGFREIREKWLQRRKEGNATTSEGPMGDTDTPVASIPQDLPSAQVGVDGTSSPSQSTDSLPSTVSSPTLSAFTTSDSTPTGSGKVTVEGSSEQTPTVTRHETFYFEDGNVEIMCGHTTFRVHSPIVSFSSPRLRGMLSNLTPNAPTPEGCPRVVFEDSAEDFAVLLKMIYTPGFPTWHKVMEFSVFASLLRMSTKYGFSDVCEQLIHSLAGAYPTTWEAHQTADVLGEDIFGLPKPHPNAVLNLFLEQEVKFAIPLAAYRAALGGFSSLLSSEPDTTLPRLALASAIYGMDTIQSEVSGLAHSIVCSLGLKECCEGGCVVNGGDADPDQRMEGLNKIYHVLVKEGKGDVFSLSLGDAVCADCAAAPEHAYHLWCTMIWEGFPRIFGVGESWEEV